MAATSNGDGRSAAGLLDRIALPATPPEVRRAIDERIWLPLFRTLPDRSITLSLVIDTADSMNIWHPAPQEVARLLEGIGAFRRVEVRPA